MAESLLIGPFRQIVTLRNLPMKGSIPDTDLELIEEGGIVVENGRISDIVSFTTSATEGRRVFELEGDLVTFPGMVDCHTHLCFAGSRAADYALKVGGASYQEILRNGGGIHTTVAKTREASENELVKLMAERATRHLMEGVTTIEVKSGYGLSVEHELKMLKAVHRTAAEFMFDLVPTCLAAHVKPREIDNEADYLQIIVQQLLPEAMGQGLAARVDIFVEEGAFNVALSREYLRKAHELGFQLTVHADQFSSGGARLAAEMGALSADHLEASTADDIKYLAQSETVGVVLPGASMGLGLPFAPARKLLDSGGCLAIATDWNPGSAPMGDLLMQAAVLGASQKLSLAETWAAVTFRAAKALGLGDRGILAGGMQADFIAFPTADYREVLYHQGKMKPAAVWKRGVLVE